MINRIGFNTVLYPVKPDTNAAVVLAPGKNVGTQNVSANNIAVEKALKRMGVKECQTCNNRRYQDESNDPGVSFKAPTHISPEAAAAAVTAHENEHVSHEQARARQEDRKIIFQSVQIYTSVCPECGKVYVSGGKTTTVTSGVQKQNFEAAGLILDRYV